MRDLHVRSTFHLYQIVFSQSKASWDTPDSAHARMAHSIPTMQKIRACWWQQGPMWTVLDYRFYTRSCCFWGYRSARETVVWHRAVITRSWQMVSRIEHVRMFDEAPLWSIIQRALANQKCLCFIQLAWSLGWVQWSLIPVSQWTFISNALRTFRLWTN